MEFSKVSISVRQKTRKGGAHKVRAGGLVPGVLYGHKEEPVAVSFDENTLLKSLDKDRRRLQDTVRRLSPRLLLLDPLVRLHRRNENDAAERDRC